MATERLTTQEPAPHNENEVKYPHTLLQKIPLVVSTTEYGLPGKPEIFLAITTDESKNPKFERRIRFLDENGFAVLKKTRKDDYGPGKPVEFSEDEVMNARKWYFEYKNNFPEIYHNRSSSINTLPEPELIDTGLEEIEKVFGIESLKS